MSYNPMSDFLPPEARRFDPRDPDTALVALFRLRAVENAAKSKEAGRPIFDDVEEVEIRGPGSKDVKVFPATAISADIVRMDPYTGAVREITYAERFAHQYRQFKAQAAQTKSGTLLEAVSFLPASRKAELRAFNIYTVEQLAQIDGQELKNLGMGGRDLKNSAQAYIDDAKSNIADLNLRARIEAVEARNQMLEQDLAILQQKRADGPHPRETGEAQFDGMTDAELREYIKIHTGSAPVGQPAHKNLVRMAVEARPAR
jgi:hypothetical protein